MQVRAGYPTYPNAVKPPFVLFGDDLAADRFWFGDLFNTWAEKWITYWCEMGTAGPGNFVMSSQEDAGVSQALQFLTSAGRADNTRELVLRCASDYTLQPAGQTPAQFLATYVFGGFSGYQESLSDAYIVGGVLRDRDESKIIMVSLNPFRNPIFPKPCVAPRRRTHPARRRFTKLALSV